MIKKVRHPSSREPGKLINEWRAAVEDLRNVVTPDPDADNTVPNYSTRFAERDYTRIPLRDLPFGTPPWLGNDAAGRAAKPRHNNSVERDPNDLLHTLIWRAPPDQP